MNDGASGLPANHGVSKPAASADALRSASMIGVLCKISEQAAVSEFFELFKTSWEFHRTGKSYDVILSTTGEAPEGTARLVLVFASGSGPIDARRSIQVKAKRSAAMLCCQGDRIPLYRHWAQLVGGDSTIAMDEATGHPAIVACQSGTTAFVRAGYDLFAEVEALLTEGQTAENAGIPTLELHIALIRDLILNSSLPVVEIPAVPDGFSSTACLTHDVDHPSIRLHKFDHTTAGFLYRAIAGSFIKFFQGRIPAKRLAKNLWAALKLPLVHMHLAKDFWLGFDRYLELEHGLGSTFYFIPFRDNPGRGIAGKDPQEKRGTKYGVDDLANHVRKFISSGCEVGLHGIDAWADSSKAREELKQISSVTGSVENGVRMHWLYFDETSFSILEQAGFSYDSTVGFNETVGYRSGTIQPYKPPVVSRLIELPLHIMDTALFYPSYLHLTEVQAHEVVQRMAAQGVRFGGVLTINWHDRSIMPERLWDEFYVQFVTHLKRNGTWFPTAVKAVSWFRKRRQAVFDVVEFSGSTLRINASMSNQADDLPALRMRVHKPRARFPNGGAAFQRTGQFLDSSFKGRLTLNLDL